MSKIANDKTAQLLKIKTLYMYSLSLSLTLSSICEDVCDVCLREKKEKIYTAHTPLCEKRISLDREMKYFVRKNWPHFTLQSSCCHGDCAKWIQPTYCFAIKIFLLFSGNPPPLSPPQSEFTNLSWSEVFATEVWKQLKRRICLPLSVRVLLLHHMHSHLLLIERLKLAFHLRN